jgi:cytochrome P450
MLRHAARMRRDPLGFLVECAALEGLVVEFPIPRQRVYFVNDPDAVTRILQGNHRAYGKSTVQYRSLALVTGDGLLVSEGERWLRGRRLVQPAFHQRTLEALGQHVADASQRLIGQWERLPDASVVDVDEAMMRTTLEVVGQALFSTDLGPQAGELVGAVLAALDRVVARARSPLPLPLSWPTPGNRRLRTAVRRLDVSVAAMVRQRRAAMSLGESSLGESSSGGPESSPGGPGSHADLLGLLLDPEAGAEDAEVRDQVVTLIVAGQETVASALTWAWWLVAGDAQVADRLAEESDLVLGGRPPTVADFAKLPYARLVLDETLRLFPPAWVITRRVLADDVLAGVPVPAGALIIVSTYALHRNPSVWDRPGDFDPERFRVSAPGVSAGGAARRGYLPFGSGPRMCIGREFALVEGVLMLASVAGRFRLERLPEQVVRPDPSVTIRPRGGLPLRLRRR